MAPNLAARRLMALIVGTPLVTLVYFCKHGPLTASYEAAKSLDLEPREIESHARPTTHGPASVTERMPCVPSDHINTDDQNQLWHCPPDYLVGVNN